MDELTVLEKAAKIREWMDAKLEQMAKGETVCPYCHRTFTRSQEGQA